VYTAGDQEEERWRVTAVEDTLRVAKSADTRGRAVESGTQKGGTDDSEARVVLAELELPRWLTTADVGAPMEALGEFYARTGRVE
jgi:hypothetical protein